MARLMESKTLSVSIQCDTKKVYEFVSHLENLPKWATTFCRSIRETKGQWTLETPQGPVKVRMAEKNDFGVLDHTASPSPGVEVLVPMRVVPNEQGSEVIFTLFRRPEMSDAQYAQDMGMVEQDLKSLKNILEAVRS